VGHQGHRERPAQSGGDELRHPETTPRFRQRHEQTARGHLHPAQFHPGRRRHHPAHQGHDGGVGGREDRPVGAGETPSGRMGICQLARVAPTDLRDRTRIQTGGIPLEGRPGRRNTGGDRRGLHSARSASHSRHLQTVGTDGAPSGDGPRLGGTSHLPGAVEERDLPPGLRAERPAHRISERRVPSLRRDDAEDPRRGVGIYLQDTDHGGTSAGESADADVRRETGTGRPVRHPDGEQQARPAQQALQTGGPVSIDPFQRPVQRGSLFRLKTGKERSLSLRQRQEIQEMLWEIVSSPSDR